MRYSLAVFDFDGTLVDSEACIRQSLERALDEHHAGTSTRILRVDRPAAADAHQISVRYLIVG